MGFEEVFQMKNWRWDEFLHLKINLNLIVPDCFPLQAVANFLSRSACNHLPFRLGTLGHSQINSELWILQMLLFNI